MPEPGSTLEPAASGEPGADDKTGEDETGDELRRRLLQAAATVFARKGYAGTKILDIVREAGVSTGAVYGRFDSKNDLLREAVVHSSTRGGVLASGARDVGDLLRHGARLAHRPLYPFEALRLEAYVTARRDDEVAAALADAYESWREGVEPLVTAAEAEGTIADDVDPEAVLFLFRTIYLGLLLHRGSRLAGPEPKSWEALVDRLVSSIGVASPADRPDEGREEIT